MNCSFAIVLEGCRGGCAIRLCERLVAYSIKPRQLDCTALCPTSCCQNYHHETDLDATIDGTMSAHPRVVTIDRDGV